VSNGPKNACNDQKISKAKKMIALVEDWPILSIDYRMFLKCPCPDREIRFSEFRVNLATEP
jgi:hypothetical protein